jgi:DNA invertase Pin-like site-specific DNA recombinase
MAANNRTFRPKQEQVLDLWNTVFPVDVLWGIYARQSSPAQLINHPESTEMQTDDLRIWLLKRRVPEGNIYLFDADLGLSGRLRIDQRTALQELVVRIQTDEIKAVLVYRVSRLFRDETGVQYNTFLTICREHSCILVTADGMLFNFNIEMHRKMFRFLAEQAADYLPQQMQILFQAKLRKARKGLYVGLGPVPIGYIVDYDIHSPTYKRYLVYRPHAEIVFYLFKRFYELEGDFSALVRELEAMPIVFPDVEEGVDRRNTFQKRRKKVPGGFHISKDGLRLLLTNPAYLGWWIVQGDVISRENHPAIIDKANEYLFWYAFEHLADYTTDGKENGNRRNGSPRRFYQRHTQVVALLNKKKLFSSQGKVFIHLTGEDWTYQIVPPDYTIKRGQLCEIDIDVIDTAFTERFLERLSETHDFDSYLQWVEEEAAQQAVIANSLLCQLQEIENRQEAILDERLAIRTQINAKVREAVEKEPQADVNTLKKKYEAEVAGDLERLERKSLNLDSLKETLNLQLEPLQNTQQVQTARKFATFQGEVEKLREAWPEKPIEARAEFVNLFIERVVLTLMAPHWVKVDIYWRHPAWEQDTLIVYRNRGNAPRWTDEERDIVRAYYPSAPREEILQRLPTKTWRSIRSEARRLQIRRPKQAWEDIPYVLTWADLEFMQEQGITSLDTKCEASSRRGRLVCVRRDRPVSRR